LSSAGSPGRFPSMTSEKSRAKRAPRGVAAAHRRRATQQLRALAHPLRLRLLEVFALGRRTTMQVAAQMGEPPTRLYHHVHALQRAGILKLVDTRQVRGTTEKYFELARKKIGNLRGEHLTAASRAPLTVIAAAVLDEARAEFLAAIAAPSKLTRATAPVALRMLLTVPPSRLPGVRRRLTATPGSSNRTASSSKAGRRFMLRCSANNWWTRSSLTSGRS